MPFRPANVGSQKDLFQTVNQNLRETNNRIDDLAKRVPNHSFLKSASTLTFGLIGANTAVERTFLLQGASVNGVAHVSPKLTLGNSNLMWSAYVSKANQVTVRLLNPTGAGVMPNVVSWNVLVVQ